MTEYRANQRRNWKGEVFPYDLTFPDDTEECNFCLTLKQAEIIRGIIEPLAWETRWYSDTQEIDRDTITTFRDDIIRRLIMACCGGEFEIIFQWTEDGVLQQSDDGGTTWEDVPQEDPRNSSTTYPPVPDVEGQDKKCNAAKGVRDLIKEQVGDQLTDDMSRYTLGQLIHDWVTTYIQTSNPFEALITIITNQILALVIATLRPALTDDVYDKLECCVYNNMADDLSFSDGQWESVRECITSDITGIAGIFLEHLVFLLGKVGLTNMARSQAVLDATCDCEECCNDLRGWTVRDLGQGTINEENRTCNYFECASFLGGDGKYYVVVVDPSNAGAEFDAFGDLYSSITSGASAWWQPPETAGVGDPHVGTVPHGALTDQLVNGIVFVSNTPFTATFTSKTC